MSNRLAGSISPYLAAHADDPVDWRPWGPHVMADASAGNRPILLSCGYASCHWCHVMQRESFRDDETAAFINEHFVPVKVDREERPDLDSLYMDYVVAATGSGGWPLTVFLTPPGAPFAGGTYFPHVGSEDVPSFMDILEGVRDAWDTRQVQVQELALQALDFLREHAAPQRTGAVSRDVLDEAAQAAMHQMDEEHGGFGEAPKFPQATYVSFLLAYARLTGDPQVPYAIERALTGMVRGGIFDQAGGGIARYATDAAWLVPHFEKMLYDNALLLGNLAGLQALEPSEELAHAARSTAAFLERDLASPEGGFYSSLSAETEGVEGATYVWTYEELAEALSPEELEVAVDALGVTEKGNWHGTNVLTRREGLGEDPERVDAVLAKILEARGKRPQPATDTKVITSWNALAATGLIEAGDAFGDDGMRTLGLRTLQSVLSRAVSGTDVVHVADDPSVADVRLAEDYASLVAACLTAHDRTGDPAWLDQARILHAATVETFAEGPIVYMTASDTDLPVRPREQSDEPIPSGASLAADNAVRLWKITAEEEFRAQAEGFLSISYALADFAPGHAGIALVAMARLLEGE